MKKIILTISIFLMLFNISGCGSSKEYLSVVSTNPRNAQVDVLLDAKIVITMSKSFGDILQNTITDNSLSVLDDKHNPVIGNVNMVGNKIIFIPNNPLLADTRYEVVVSKTIKDLDKNTLKQDYIYSFTTKKQETDQNKPSLKVTSIFPNNNAQNIDIAINITITFNESINSNSIGNNNLSLIDTQGNVIKANTRAVGNRIIIDPSSDLFYDTNYTLSITKSVKAENGYSLENIYSSSFTTKKEIQDNELPTKPTNINTSNITTNSITLSWDSSSDSDGNITNYYISYKTTGSYGNEVSTTSTNKVISSLNDNTDYTFRIRAKDNDGGYSEYAYSNTIKTSERVAIISTSSLKKTGQTTSYENYDDGYYQIGVSPNYTRSNNVVTDNVTNLQWQDDNATRGLSISSQSLAISYCTNLILAGHNDWRLPVKKELLSIVNYGRYDPAKYSIFENVASSDYWSATTNVNDTSRSWIVYFKHGYDVLSSSTQARSYLVRCVRSE